MARLNVEEEIFKDRRYQKLMIRLGSPEAAMGAVVLCWLTAQKFWKDSDHGIPKTEWLKQDLRNEIVEVGLAEDLGDFVKVVGSEKHFAWIRQRVEAGRRGGASKSPDKVRHLKQNQIIEESTEAKPKRDRSKTEASSSYSYSKEETTTTPASGTGVREAWEAWNDTLEYFGLPRSRIAMTQQTSIARAITQIGLENTLLALEGARYEPAGDTFRPKDHLSVDRVLHRDAKGTSRWEKLKNLALAKRGESEMARRSARDAEATA